MTNNPPKPRFALALGVTGHRLRRKETAPGEAETNPRPFDVAAVRLALDACFRDVVATFAAVEREASDAFAADPPEITLISSLAEGADRIAASAALDAGLSLDVVLPCPASIYAQTFDGEASRGDFDELMARARACLVLPLAGAPEHPLETRLSRSYEAAGLTLLDQCDVLVAVWDGKPADGRGGTGQIADEAARRGAPILVVDPANGATRMLWADPLSGEAAARHAEDIAPRSVESCLAVILGRLVALPASPHERLGLREYFAAPARAPSKGGARASLVFDGDDIDRSRSTWPRLSAAIVASPANLAAVRRYAAALRAAEEVAGGSAQRYRGLFYFNFGASAFASLAVASAAWWEFMHVWAATLELLVVGTVGTLVYMATRSRWHNQWFEAREVVERLRILAIPWLLGAWPVGLGPSQSSWSGWYARAVTRELPLFSGALGELLGEARDVLRALVEEQIAYHRRNAGRLERRDHAYEAAGLALLIGSIGNNALFIAFFGVAWATGWTGARGFEPWSFGASIVLPAAATACYGVRLFGDFEDLARRSKGTASRLETLKARLVGDLDLVALRALADEAARAMLSDLDAWRVAVESRRLSAS